MGKKGTGRKYFMSVRMHSFSYAVIHCILLERSSVGISERSSETGQDSDNLPVAALTKEQLLQALMNLLKVNSPCLESLMFLNSLIGFPVL